jgi:hypothetical protein
MGWERSGGDQSMAAPIAAKIDSYGPDRAVDGLAAEKLFIDDAARGDGWSTVPRLGERQRNDDEMRDRAPTSWLSSSGRDRAIDGTLGTSGIWAWKLTVTVAPEARKQFRASSIWPNSFEEESEDKGLLGTGADRWRRLTGPIDV